MRYNLLKRKRRKQFKMQKFNTIQIKATSYSNNSTLKSHKSQHDTISRNKLKRHRIPEFKRVYGTARRRTQQRGRDAKSCNRGPHY